MHINLFEPIRTVSLGKKKYGLIIADEFPRYTWVIFLANKNNSLDAFKNFVKKV